MVDRFEISHKPGVARRTLTVQRQRGVSLVELLIVLAITGLIVLATAAMLSAAEYATTTRKDARSVQVRARTIALRLNHALRTAQSIVHPATAAATDHCVGWLADANNDKTRQNNEMMLIERDTATSAIIVYQNDADTADFVDAATFRTSALAGYPSIRWSTGVGSLSFATRNFPPGSVMTTYRVTVTSGNESGTVIGAVAPR